MLTINTKRLGRVHVGVHINPNSAVDAFAEDGYREDTDLDLTDEEMDYINEEYAAEIHEYAWQSGETSNHN